MVRYAPELVAAVRHRYEETDQPMPAIAAECGMSLRALHRMVEREGWSMRSERPPRNLPPAARLFEEARTLANQKAGATAAEDDARQAPTAAAAQDANQEANQEADNDSRSAVDRLEALVMKEIAAEEAARSVLRGAPRSRSEARDVTRNLSTLTQTLQTLRRMRAGEKTDGTCANCPYYDPVPEDIDEFRLELARRISAFIESREEAARAAGEEGGETGGAEGH
jgi:hypothetical protein